MRKASNYVAFPQSTHAAGNEPGYSADQSPYSLQCHSQPYTGAIKSKAAGQGSAPSWNISTSLGLSVERMLFILTTHPIKIL